MALFCTEHSGLSPIKYKKIDFYSDGQAENLLKRGRTPGRIELLFIPMLAFIKFFIFRKGFLLGIDGIILGHMYAFHRFLRIAKVRELTHQKNSTLRMSDMKIVNIMLGKGRGGLEQVAIDYHMALTSKGHQVLRLLTRKPGPEQNCTP